MKMNFKSVRNKLGNGKVYCDPSFQRRVSWTKKDMNSFLSAATKGWARQPITLACVESCLDYAELQQDEPSIRYFRDLKERNYKYVSIDGQNRTNFIIDLINNDVQVSGRFFGQSDDPNLEGEYVDVKSSYLSKGNNCIFNKHRNVYEKIIHTQLHVNLYSQVSREELADIFRNINSGNPLNPHGYRQSLATPVADWVRKISDDNREMLKKIIVEEERKNMLDDEFIAKICMILMKKYSTREGQLVERHWGLAKTDIDSYYSLGLGYSNFSDPGCPYYVSEKVRIEKIIKIVNSLIMNQSIFTKLVPKRFVFACAHLAEYVHDNDLYIANYKDCAAKLNKIENDLYQESETKYTKDRQALLNKGEDPKHLKKTNYYYRQTQLPHQRDKRLERQKTLLEQIRKEQSDMGIRQLRKEENMAA